MPAGAEDSTISRDGSGNYSLPAGNPVVTGTTISSTTHNTTMSDVASALTQSVSKDGQTAMTGTLNMGSNPITNTTAFTATGIITGGSFIPTSATIPTNGLYLSAANTLSWGINSANAMTLVAASLTAPAFIPTSTTVPTNGLYLQSAGVLALSSNTILRWSVNSTGNHVFAAPTAGVAISLSGFAGSAVVNMVGSGTGSLQTWTDGTRTALLNTVAGGYQLLVSSNHTLALGANNTVYWTLASTGGLSNAAPASGVALTLTAVASSAALVANGGAYTPTIDLGNSSTAFTMDCSRSNAFKVLMNGNVAAGSLTISNLSEGQSVNLMLTQDGTGTRTLGNPTGVKWPGASVGVLSTAAGSVDLIVFSKINSVTIATITKAFA